MVQQIAGCGDCIWKYNWINNERPCCNCILSNNKPHIEVERHVTFTLQPVMPITIQIQIDEADGEVVREQMEKEEEEQEQIEQIEERVDYELGEDSNES
jgi:hypothetical protein